MKPNELIEIAHDNSAEAQMEYEQYECLIALIEDGTISSIGQLSEYMEITEEESE